MKRGLRYILIIITLVVLPLYGHSQCPSGSRACIVTVYCDDMVGDGWNGGMLQVWQDTVLRGTVSLSSGYEGTYDVIVCSEDSMRFVWIAGPLDYEVSFSIVNGDGSVIVSDVMAGGISSGSIVAMAMPACPTCVRPVNLVCAADSVGAMVSWTPVGDETQWLLYLNGTLHSVVSSTSQYLSGLTINTDYTVGVRALCSMQDTSEMLQGGFRTSCQPLSLPYYNSFDSETNGELPSCWNPIITFGEAPKVFDEAAFSDSLSLFFAASGWNVVATPLVPVPGNLVNVSFRAMLEEGINLGTITLFNSRLRVGVMTDLNDTGTFVPMVDIRAMDNTWRDYEFNTSLLDSTVSYYVAFFFKGDDMLFGNGFVDDLSITFDNGCHRLENVRVDSVGSRCARLSWSAGEDNVTGYNVYYSTENNVLNANFYAHVVDTAVVLWGLNQSTTYYVWVRSVCGEDLSDYKAVAPFTTMMTCSPVTEVRLSNVHYSAAMVSWQYDVLNGNPPVGAWVRLFDRQASAFPVVDTFVYGNSIVFTGLQPSHCYSASVRSICQNAVEESDTANSVVYEFMTNSCSEIAGDGTSSSPFFFVNTNLTNSYTQTLYLRSEMPAVDTVWGIAYHTSTGVSEPLGLSLYMANTSLSNLGSNAYVPADSLRPMVMNHVIQPSSAEWQVVYFDTPFVYDTLRNMVVAVTHGGSSFTLNPSSWYYHPTGHTSTVSWSSFSPISMYSPSSLFGVSALQSAVDVRLIADCSVSECQSPMVVDVTEDSTSLSVMWISDGIPPSGFVVQYKQAGSANYIMSGVTTALSYTVTGLSPATLYDLRVGSLCDGDTLWDYYSVTTACGSVHVPYAENFDGYPAGVMPPCWRYSRSVVSHQYGGLFWNPSYSVSAAVLPAFEYPVNRLEIDFKAMLSPVTEGEAILVGVTDDEGSFIDWVDTLSERGQSLSHYTWFRHDFRDYAGSGNRIVLAHSATVAEATLIDDITVTEAVGCIPVSRIVANNLDDASNIVVSWNNPCNASLWQLAWDTIGTRLESMRNVTTVSDTFYTLPPLVSGGKYTVYVRTVCGTSQSVWRSFDFAAGTVIMRSNAVDTVIGCGLVIYDDGGAWNDYSNGSNSVLIVRPTSPSMSVQLNGGTVDLYPWGGDTLRVYDGEGTSGALLYSISSTYGSEQIGRVLVSESGPMTFQFVSDNFSPAAGYELFTTCVQSSSCRRPRNVEVFVLSPNSARVTWVGSASSYEVSYRAEGTTVWRTININMDTVITLSGLTAGTRYDLYVQGFCEGGQSSPASIMVSFTTLCDAYRVIAGNPIEESFESAEAPSPCFSTRKANGNPNEMVHGSEISFNGNKSFRFSSYQPASDYNQYLISPLLEAEDSITLRFRYCDLMYGNERLRVGYSVTGNSIDDFVWTDTLTTTGIMWKLFKRDYPSNTRFLAINYCSDYRYYAFVDSLQISVVASVDCQAPVITNVTEDTESITVFFDAEGLVEAYITDQSWNDNATGVTVTGQRYTFTGLQPNTEYTIGLRSHCTSGISSRWTTRRVLTSTENCPAPNDFVLEDIGYSSATFSWTGDSPEWEINLYNLVYDHTFRVTESPFTVTGLYSDFTYHARIRSLCNGLPGRWCDTVIAFSPLVCEPVTNLESHVIDVDSGVVLISWQSQVGRYELDYGLEHFTVGGGTKVSDITDEYYRLEGLTPGETYDYYVRAQCDESSYSIYSQRGVFTLTSECIFEVRNDIETLLYPNPATGTTTLSIGGVQDYLDIQVVDVCGRVVKSSHLFCPNGCKMQLDLGHLQSGVYFVHIAGQSVNMIEKLIVK